MYFEEGSALCEATKDHDHFVARVAFSCNCKILPDRKAISDILKRQYSFPDNSRIMMWRYLLRLPNNEQQYSVIFQQPIHKLVQPLMDSLPIKFGSTLRRVVRIISSLVYWHPPLSECDWLPGLVYPFLCLYQRNKIQTVETLMTVIYNWCMEWLMFIPNPPVTVLSRIDKIAKEMGGSAPLKHAWPALRSFFGEVAKTDSALVMLDNIIASRPPFLEYLVASFCVLKDREINSSNVKQVINRARKFYEAGWKKNHNQSVFTPLPEGYYPILPIVEKSVMWKERELQRIRKEAEEMQKERELAREINQEANKIEMKRKIWMNQRKTLIQIEEEQMEDFQRREKEIIERAKLREKALIEENKKALENQLIQEENYERQGALISIESQGK